MMHILSLSIASGTCYVLCVCSDDGAGVAGVSAFNTLKRLVESICTVSSMRKAFLRIKKGGAHSTAFKLPPGKAAQREELSTQVWSAAGA